MYSHTGFNSGVLDVQSSREAPEIEVLDLEGLLDDVKKNGPLSTVVALGHNWSRSENNWEPQNTPTKNMPNTVDLTIQSKTTALSSYLLFLAGLTKGIIFSGGKTAGDAQPSEAAAMRDYVKYIIFESYAEDPLGNVIRKPGANDQSFEDAIEAKQIVIEETSKNTVENAEKSIKLLGDTKKRVGLMSVGSHIKLRAKRIFDRVDTEQKIQIGLSSNELLVELLGYISNNLPTLNKRLNFSEQEFLRIKFEADQLLQDYDAFLNKTPFRRSFGPEYHMLASAAERVLDASGLDKVLTKIAAKKRGGNQIPKEG